MSKTPTKRLQQPAAGDEEEMQITPPKNLKLDDEQSATPSPSRLCYQMNALDDALNNYFSPKKKSPGRSPGRSAQRKLHFLDDESHDENEMVEEVTTKGPRKCLNFNENCAKCSINLCFQHLNTNLTKNSNYRTISESFPKWLMLLRSGEFNILLQGPGSKRKLLNNFTEYVKGQQISIKNMHIFRINGLNENISISSILVRIGEEFGINNIGKRKMQSKKGAQVLVKELKNKLIPEEFVILILDNIDSPQLRLRAHQEAFSIMAESKIFRIIASVDHPNAALLWNQSLRDAFNWLNYTINCYRGEMQEENEKLLGYNPKENARGHTFESLDMFWEATTKNMQKILKHLAIHAPLYSKRNQRDPLTLPKFCQILKEDFATTSETVLRQQLIEFQDHNIAKLDRDENIHLIVDQQLLSAFLDKKFS